MGLYSIPYGKGSLQFELEDNRLKAVLCPRYSEQIDADQRTIVQKALEHPIGSKRLRELSKGKGRILVITSDHTRPVPSAITLPVYLDEIRSENSDAEIIILVATGLHRSPTKEELREKFTDNIIDNEKIVIHNARDNEHMVFLGELPSGGELWLNDLVKWADLIVAEGFIEPHFFAGYSGGRKSVLPGIASKVTILYNHNSTFIKNVRSVQGSINENPIHLDMVYASQQANLAFILNVLLDSRKRIVVAVAGDPIDAHLAGCAICENHTRAAPVLADIVITSNGGYPLDQNVYQAVKGMTAAEACVREGGVIIMCAALGDGHGGEEFYHWFTKRDSAAAVLREIESIQAEMTTQDQWQAQILARVLNKARCIFVTGEENRDIIEGMHMKWASDIKAALALTSEIVGKNASVIIIPDGVNIIISSS